jgi:hypothetical protein
LGGNRRGDGENEKCIFGDGRGHRRSIKRKMRMIREMGIVESVNTLSFGKRTCAKTLFKKAFTEKRFAERIKIGGDVE